MPNNSSRALRNKAAQVAANCLERAKKAYTKEDKLFHMKHYHLAMRLAKRA
jgi:hypothetical protein